MIPRTRGAALLVLALAFPRSPARADAPCGRIDENDARAMIPPLEAWDGAVFPPLAEWLLDPMRTEGPDLAALFAAGERAASEPSARAGLYGAIMPCYDSQVERAKADAANIRDGVAFLHRGHDGSAKERQLVEASFAQLARMLARDHRVRLDEDRKARALDAYRARNRAAEPDVLGERMRGYEAKAAAASRMSLDAFLRSGGFTDQERARWSAEIAGRAEGDLQDLSLAPGRFAAMTRRLSEINRLIAAQEYYKAHGVLPDRAFLDAARDAMTLRLALARMDRAASGPDPNRAEVDALMTLARAAGGKEFDAVVRAVEAKTGSRDPAVYARALRQELFPAQEPVQGEISPALKAWLRLKGGHRDGEAGAFNPDSARAGAWKEEFDAWSAGVRRACARRGSCPAAERIIDLVRSLHAQSDEHIAQWIEPYERKDPALASEIARTMVIRHYLDAAVERRFAGAETARAFSLEQQRQVRRAWDIGIALASVLPGPDVGLGVVMKGGRWVFARLAGKVAPAVEKLAGRTLADAADDAAALLLKDGPAAEPALDQAVMKGVMTDSTMANYESLGLKALPKGLPLQDVKPLESIRSLIQDKERFARHLGELDAEVARTQKLEGLAPHDALEKVLGDWETRGGFKPVTDLPSGCCSTEEFNRRLADGALFRDHAFTPGSSHGIDTHRIQWNVVMRDMRANPSAYEGTRPVDLLRLMGDDALKKTLDWTGTNGTSKDLWFELFDVTDTRNFGQPEYLTRIRARLPALNQAWQ